MKSKQNKMSYRALARVLHRSPSHVYRVMNGERKSASLLEALKRQGNPPSRCALRRTREGK